MKNLMGQMEQLLRQAFEPELLQIGDLTEQHRGHAGNISGGSHFRLKLVSEKFLGLSSLQRHRRVYEVLGELLQGQIHALAMDLKTPEEVSGASMASAPS